MRHQKHKVTLDRDAKARNALLLGLLRGLFINKKIKTTLAKAKFCGKNAERILTMAKNDTLATRRNLLESLRDRKLVNDIIKNIAPKFKEKKGGYTRITKLGTRKGDRAEIAQLEILI